MRRFALTVLVAVAGFTFPALAAADPTMSGTVTITNANSLYPVVDVSASITTAACDTTDGYCGWFGFATVVPAGTGCSQSGSTVWVGPVTANAGTESGAIDPVSLLDDGTICVYVDAPDGMEPLATSAPFTLPPPSGTASISLTATTVPLQGTSASGTVTTTENGCIPGACVWFASLTVQKGTVCAPTLDDDDTSPSALAALAWLSSAQSGADTITDDYAWSPSPSTGTVIACAYLAGDDLASAILIGSKTYTFASALTVAAAKPKVTALLHQRIGRVTRSLSERCTRPSKTRVACTIKATIVGVRWTGRITLWTVANSTKLRDTVTLHKTRLPHRS